MMRHVRKNAGRLLATGAMLLIAVIAPTIAWAQEQEAPRAPTLSRPQPAWVGLLFMAVLLGVVLAISLMPSKRSHQD
jgi:hypothetical protein